MNYVLKYRATGKRLNTTRWSTRPVSSVTDAVEWMNAHKSEAFLPAFVLTSGWRTETVAILGKAGRSFN